ncbi:hypothetical protein [Cupriavidus campinensis]|uniref:Uncharacterized protein n=1 Tax=Cupriavidus campinensis TaxID=151783 RepID=A0ABY3ESK2_9BURK|nr:hypothetical protein [Cupriavidus campinensis]TSP13949.1 hypothetical protein FGG12_05605 [Cupriavidus campinensis]
MRAVPADTDVTIPVAFTDSGVPYVATAAAFKLLDENEVTLSSGDVALATDGLSGSVLVPAAQNTLAAGEASALRVLNVRANKEGGDTAVFQIYYSVVADERLLVGINSFQSLTVAHALTMQVANTEHWDKASDEDRIRAMIEARDRICRLRFDFSRVDEWDWFNRLSYANLFVPTDLSYLNAEQLLSLEPTFLRKLRMAQVVEANEILAGPDSTENKRREGLTLDTIGNVKQMFRSSKPLELPVSRRALAYLAGYVSLSLRVGR